MRAVLLVLGITALAVVAGFFGNHPGTVVIRWQGWRADTSVGFLIAAVILAAFLLAVFFLAARALLRLPRRWLAARRERRHEKGYRALWDGLLAIAAGDAREGARLARRAENLLSRAPPSLFLRAQTAELEGDASAAQRYRTLMLEHPETRLLALRSLFAKALGEGDHQEAESIARRAKAIAPGAPWITTSLFASATREGRWKEAERTLAEASARLAFPAERARHYRGVLLCELSREAAAAGERRHALALAASAEAFCPDLAAPAAHHARLLLEEGRAKAAARVVENAWRTAPHPELSRVYATIFAGEPSLQGVKRFERLAAQNPEARESHLALAEAALAAGLWGQARHSLQKALAAALPPSALASPEHPLSEPIFSAHSAAAGEIREIEALLPAGKAAPEAGPGLTPRLCFLMARLEEAEYGDEKRARGWRERTLAAAPDPAYLCAECHGESPEWHSLCPFCGAFDGLVWRTPQRALALPLPPAASALIALSEARRTRTGEPAEDAKRLGGVAGRG